MKISILTLFPAVFQPTLSTSILGRAAKKGLVVYNIIDIRDFGLGKHRTVDDKPYGGGAGMILRADVLTKAWQSMRPSTTNQKPYTILMSAAGKPFKQDKASELSKLQHLNLVCGHYEGVDQRFVDHYVDEEISIGDFVVSGGEIPALAVIDAVVRLIPKVLEKPQAIEEESFSTFHLPSSTVQLLEYPQYTRPEIFENLAVPKVLLSGDHRQILKWRQQQSLEKTGKVRPDLLKGITLA